MRALRLPMAAPRPKPLTKRQRADVRAGLAKAIVDGLGDVSADVVRERVIDMLVAAVEYDRCGGEGMSNLSAEDALTSLAVAALDFARALKSTAG